MKSMGAVGLLVVGFAVLALAQYPVLGYLFLGAGLASLYLIREGARGRRHACGDSLLWLMPLLPILALPVVDARHVSQWFGAMGFVAGLMALALFMRMAMGKACLPWVAREFAS
jgi:hypothetical protein